MTAPGNFDQFIGHKVKIVTADSPVASGPLLVINRNSTLLCVRKSDGTIIFFATDHITCVIPVVPADFGGGIKAEAVAVLD